jgi:predicted acylesterase/phospholipase RssA
LELGDFSRQLAEALGSLGSTLVWDPERFDELYGKPGASQTPLDHPTSSVLNAWLDEHEHQHQFVIYTSPLPLDSADRLTPWARRCAEDADIILLVGDDKMDPAPTAVEACLATTHTQARMELALLHSTHCQVPSGTLNWLTPRRSGAAPLQAHHHLRLGNSADFGRLARRLSGHPIALTLGGGGARGWAHIGVIRAVEEAQVQVDWVGGASMGAIIAAAYALDWPVEKMNQLAVSFSDPKKLLDYTLPYASITATRRITALLQELYGESQLEDAWRPYFCVSANLTRGEEQTHISGLMWKAVRASMAFPGVFAPVFEDGCVLIDGGAANNVPVDRMRELCPTGTVIGVELNTSSPVTGKYNFGPSLSGWQVLFSRLNPFVKAIQAPTLVDIVSGIVYSNNRYRLNETWQCADLLVRVPVETFGLLEFDKYAQIIETGYTSTREQIKGFQCRKN